MQYEWSEPLATANKPARLLGVGKLPLELMSTILALAVTNAPRVVLGPGVGITRDARIAIKAGQVMATHDPTEGGIVTVFWELAPASGRGLRVDSREITVSDLAYRVCRAFTIDPYCAIASGALLLTAPPSDTAAICNALTAEGIACAEIGVVTEGPGIVERKTPAGYEEWPRPAADAITQAFA